MSEQDWLNGYNSAQLAIQVLEQEVNELEAERDRLREALTLVDNCIPRIMEDEMDRIISPEAVDAVGKALEGLR